MALGIGFDLLLALLLGVSSPAIRAEPPPKPRPLILAHTMPWFEAKPTSGDLGLALDDEPLRPRAVRPGREAGDRLA